MDARLLATALGVLPSILALVRDAHAATQPGAPTPTDAEVLAALATGIVDSLAVDAAWKAAHPA